VDHSRGIDGVLEDLDGVIARAAEAGDACGYFPVLYCKVTAKLAQGLGTGFFDDEQRIERLSVLFAERYLEAAAARDAGEPPTNSWALVFAAGHRWRPLILQHLSGLPQKCSV